MLLYYDGFAVFDITPWDQSQATWYHYPMPIVNAPLMPAIQFSDIGPGSTKVDTGAIRLVADNMDVLRGYAHDAWNTLKNMSHLAPGNFVEAAALRLQVTGPTGADLLDSYKGILVDIMDGLANLKTALYDIGAKYDQANSENTITVAELQNILAASGTDFSRMFPGG